ncbi:MAG: glycosyltransferase family 2 protein [Armatimonadota bacterium]
MSPAPQPADHSAGPTISVVIPAYNAAGTIERALHSVYAQTCDAITEVVVVDDGSTDGTAAIVRERFPDVTLIQQANAGGTRARNRGVAAATGDWVAFLDADDEWLPEKIAHQIQIMQRHPGIALTTCRATVLVDGDQDARYAAAPPAITRCAPALRFVSFREWVLRDAPFARFTSCSGWVVDRDVLTSLGGLDEGLPLSEDWEFLLRLSGLGYTVAVVEQPLVRYYVRGDSVSHSDQGRLEIATIVRDIVMAYDPARPGWRGELLTPSEYRNALANALWAGGWHLWELGRREQAREYLAQAAELSDAGRLAALRRRLAAWSPALYRALWRLRRWSGRRGA